MRSALSQQKITTQEEALEIAMRLHETPMQDPNLGVQQIHVQLKNICLEMQSLKQDRTVRPEVRKEVWCMKCKSQGHDKYQCMVIKNYLAGGVPMPLRPKAQVGPSVTPTLWCVIYQVAKNMPWIIAICYRSIRKLHNSCSITFVGRGDMMSILVGAMN